MPAPYQGDINNPVPNSIREPISRSEKLFTEDRASQVRRDTDSQKNITIGLHDIDNAINLHLKRINLQVLDAGKLITVPILYGSPEIWVSARRDGYLRDKQGKVQLPVIAYKRTASENDTTLQYLNRYLTGSTIIRKYSPKNKYTKFSLLNPRNAPVNEIYNIVFPSHMLLTYEFLIWTEYVQQMNTLIENIRFNTNDYWGTENGFKFRTSVDTFSHTTELQVGEDRIVKTEFNLTTHGYILPETITTLESQKLTTQKMFSPKKFIVTMETSVKGLNKLNENIENWRNPTFPNIPANEYIKSPPVVLANSSSLV